MGRVRVTGLEISLPYFQHEVETFQSLVRDPTWMTKENLEKRRTLCRGLTFLILNLAEGEDGEEAWKLFHEAMDEYHAKCDVLRLDV